jgi:hypothetical protein
VIFLKQKIVANDMYEVNFVLSSIIIIVFFWGNFCDLVEKKGPATSAKNFLYALVFL